MCMKKILTFIFCWIVLACPVLAENFYIENYNVNIIVDKNKSADITENIDVYFTNSSHGIYRDIPIQNATLSNISVSERSETTFSGPNVNIKIGDPDRLVRGRHHYQIKYKYKYLDNKNEFYHNIIGTNWNVNINRAEFHITMPEAVDKSQVGLSIGSYGTKGFNGGAVYYVKDNYIWGNTSRVLKSNEGITVRIEVPQGYFNKQVNFPEIYVIAGMIIIMLISFFIWFTFGKDEPVIPTVNFYPPKNMNPAELELAYKGEASVKGLVGMLIELARQGYIKIYDNDSDWFIQKLKDYDGDDKKLKSYMQALFKYDKKAVNQRELSTSSSFYKDCERIVESVNQKRKQIFYKNSISFPLQALMFLCLACLFFLTVFAISNYNMYIIMQNGFILLFPLIAITVLVTSIKKSQLGCFIILWSFFFGGMPLLIFLSMNQFSIFNLPAIFVGIVSLVISGICFYQLPKRNTVGQQLLNHIEGLKHFIEVSEKSRLEEMVEKDPEYFYKILPSAYILGISDKWISKFESIMPINPDWYSGSGFNAHTFSRFTQDVHGVSVPTTSNGGISSSSGGGGFSGGGGGGGGGGSW